MQGSWDLLVGIGQTLVTSFWGCLDALPSALDALWRYRSMLQARCQQDPNSGPNRHKISLFGSILGIFRVLGGLAGSWWGVLGWSWGSGGCPGGSWSVLEPSWAETVSETSRFGPPKGPLKKCQNEIKKGRFSDLSSGPSWGGLLGAPDPLRTPPKSHPGPTWSSFGRSRGFQN